MSQYENEGIQSDFRGIQSAGGEPDTESGEIVA